MGTEKKTCGKETNQREKKWFSWLRQFFSFCVKNTWIRWTGVCERERVFVYVYMFVCICLRMAGSIFIRFIITGVFRSLSARMELERIEQFKRAHNMLWEKSSFFFRSILLHTSIFTIYPVVCPCPFYQMRVYTVDHEKFVLFSLYCYC